MFQYQDWHYKVSSRPKSITVIIGRHYRAHQRLLVKGRARGVGEFIDLMVCGKGRYVLSQYSHGWGHKAKVPFGIHHRLLIAERRWL